MTILMKNNFVQLLQHQTFMYIIIWYRVRNFFQKAFIKKNKRERINSWTNESPFFILIYSKWIIFCIILGKIIRNISTSITNKQNNLFLYVFLFVLFFALSNPNNNEFNKLEWNFNVFYCLNFSNFNAKTLVK